MQLEPLSRRAPQPFCLFLVPILRPALLEDCNRPEMAITVEWNVCLLRFQSLVPRLAVVFGCQCEVCYGD